MPEGDALLNYLYDEYLPFRLYADFKSGSSVDELAECFSLHPCWVKERIEAARLCIEKQIRLEVPGPHLAPAATGFSALS
jgi:hypothetical protein